MEPWLDAAPIYTHSGLERRRVIEAMPLWVLTKVQAVRAYVQGFKSFRMPRMSNVWSTN